MATKATAKPAKKATISIKKADYPYIPQKMFAAYKRLWIGQHYKYTDRQMLNAFRKKNEEMKAVMNQPDVKRLEMEIEWKKNPTWGMCPTISYRAEFADPVKSPEYQENFSKATGCGYDKESTVVAAVFNSLMVGRAYRKAKTNKPPYGIHVSDFGLSFKGGVGMGCYRTIVEWFGGKWEHAASTRTYDKYVCTFPVRRK